MHRTRNAIEMPSSSISQNGRGDQMRIEILSTLSIATQHAIHQIPQRAPEILPARQFVLINEQDVVLEAGVEVRFETEVHYHWVMVAINVGVDTI